MADKFELSENDINQVLTIFTDIDRESVCRDLQITKSPIATINRILDGNFLIDVYQPHQGTLHFPDDSDSELLDICPPFKIDKNLPCCSTDMDKPLVQSTNPECKKINFPSEEVTDCKKPKQKYKSVNENSSSGESDLDNKTKSVTFSQKQCFSTMLSNDLSSEDDSDKDQYRPLHERVNMCNPAMFNLSKSGKHEKNSEKNKPLQLSESDDEELSHRTDSCDSIRNRTKNGLKAAYSGIENKKAMVISRGNISLSESNDSDDNETEKVTNAHLGILNCEGDILGRDNLILSSSENEDDYDMELPDIGSNGLSHESTSQNSASFTCSAEVETVNRKKTFKRRTAIEIEESKKAALLRKEQREEKKLLKEKEAAFKKEYIKCKKAVLPGECLKYIKVILDSAVVEGVWGTYILTSLQKLGINYIVEPQPVKSSITWSRKISIPEMQDNEMLLEVKEVMEDEVVLLIGIGDFVNLVFIFKLRQQEGDNMGESLRSYGQRMLDIFQGKKITFIVQGMEKYFRDLKSLQQRQFRLAVGDESARVRKQRKVTDIDIVISRVDVEEALIDLQLHTNINVRLVEALTDVGNLVAGISKGIAEAPYKRDKYKSQFSCLSDGSNSKGIRVDKDGKGLLKIWQMQIQQFHLVSPEIAGAIVAAYPSPQLLLQAYRNCSTTKEAKNLLKDIVIRRGTGVLATNRKVGPELSRKIYTLFTSKDGSLLVNEK